MSQRDPVPIFIGIFYNAPDPPQSPSDQAPVVQWHRPMTSSLMYPWASFRSRDLPPRATDGATCVSGFSFAEACLARMVNEPGNLTHDAPMCFHPECGSLATSTVNWYPFDVHEWDGESEPVYFCTPPPLILTPEDNQRRAALIVACAWCGTNNQCKGEILMALFRTFGGERALRNYFTGGIIPYCVTCGKMCETRLYDFLPYCDACFPDDK